MGLGPEQDGDTDLVDQVARARGATPMITATMVVATVPVTDLERAKQFYSDTIGLTFLWETPVAVRYSPPPATSLNSDPHVPRGSAIPTATPSGSDRDSSAPAVLGQGHCLTYYFGLTLASRRGILDVE
jgi:hypothetical protein